MLVMTAKPLSRYREEMYMPVEKFVKHLGISLTTYYRILEGERPRFTTMHRIAGKLGVKPQDIEEFAPPRDYDWIKANVHAGRLVRARDGSQVWFERLIFGGKSPLYMKGVPVAPEALQQLLEEGIIQAQEIVEGEQQNG